MPAFDNFPRASFGGIAFPYEERTIQGTIRDHEHKYPHTPGAALETLGRELYTIRFRCSFQDTLKGYPDVYPSGLARLRRAYETETRDDLVVPGLGTIKAVLVEWTQRAAPKESRSGEKVDFSFKEDIEDAFLLNNLIGISNQSLNAANENWSSVIAEARRAIFATADLNAFDAILDAVNSVLAIVDTAQAYGNVLEAKILGAAALIYQADRRVRSLNDPVNATLLYAMIQVWDALLTLHKDIQKVGGGVQTMIVAKTMSVVELSKAIYNGDASKAVDILQLNAISDAFAVPPGTTIRYYPNAA
jgi:prophage DNA circulation protein